MTNLPNTITVRYLSIDDVNVRRQFKTLAGAQAFASKWVGPHPEIGSHYAVSGDGIGKIMANIPLEVLFPAPAAAPAEVAAEAPAAAPVEVEPAPVEIPVKGAVDVLSGEVYDTVPPEQIARAPAAKAAKAPRKAPAAKAPAAKFPGAPAPGDGLTDEQRRLLMALRNARVFENVPVAERVGVWVRSAAVHDSLMPHDLPMRQVPGVMGGLKRRGLVECGWDKAATVRLTQAGIDAEMGA